MIDFNKLIKMLSKQEIQKIIEILQKELEERQERINNFEFGFRSMNVPRKAHPYVARLFWKQDKIIRQFYNLERRYEDDKVSVFGKYQAPAGAVLEIRHGAHYSSWYIVTTEGSQLAVQKHANLLIEYLKGNLTIKQVEEEIERDFEGRFGNIKNHA